MPESPPYVHLHVHSEYSILDGACRIGPLVGRAADMGMPAVGLTDHGSMAGAVELARAAGKAGVKPILGCEMYIVDDHATRVQKERRAHLTLLAETTEGYHNLVRLVSSAYLDGYWYRPRVDLDQLSAHSAGHHRPLRAACPGACARRSSRVTTGSPGRSSSGWPTSSAATTSTSSCRTAASTSRRRSTRASRR